MQGSKGNDDKTSQAERFSSLRKLFNKTVLKPKQDVLAVPNSNSIARNNNDNEEDIARYEKKDEGERLEKELSDTLKDWTYNTKLSVAVAGSKGVGKSLLINTLLETTYEEKQAAQQMSIDDDTPKKPYRPRASYGFSSGAETRMNESGEDSSDWLDNASSNPYRPRSNVKKYNQATAYAFEGSFDTPAPAKPAQEIAKPANKTPVGGLGILDVYKDLDKKIPQRPGSNSYNKVTPMDEDDDTDDEDDFRMQINKPRKSTYKRATAYIFDDNASLQTTSAPKKEFEFDVPQIDKTFEMDDEFVQNIDWEKERNNKNEYKDFLTTNQLKPDDSKPFLLPQGEGGAPAFMLRYGKIPEAIISFPKDGELRLALWELHEIAIGTKRPQSEEHLATLQRRYRRLLGLAESAPVPLPDIAAPQDLPLMPEVKALLGKNYRFAGRGRDPEEDRIFIREKLTEVSKKYGDYMCRLMVRVPAGLLEGNKELIEVSGVYSSDLNTKLALQNANLLMVAVDRKRGITGDLAALVKNSGLAEKLLSDPEQHKAIFMELEEKSKVVLPHEMLDSMDDDKFQQFKEGLSVQWKQVIRQSIPTALNNPNNAATSPIPSKNNPFAAFTPENIDKLVNEQTEVVSVKPMLFSAIHNKESFPSEMLEGLNVREVLSKTAVPSIISEVPNRAIAKAAKPIKELSNMLLNQIQHEAQMLKTMEDESVSVAPSGPGAAPQMFYEQKIERMITEFSLTVAQFKTDLAHRATTIETGLVAKTKEFVKQQNEAVSRNIRRSTSSTGLNNNSNRSTSPLQREEDLMELERFEHLNIEESTPVPIIDIAITVWRALIQEIPTKIDRVLFQSTQMLREISSVIVAYLSDSSMQHDEERKTKLRKLDEFLRLSHEKVVQRLNVLDQVFRHDPSNLIREACVAALPVQKRDQQVLEYGGDEALRASGNVKKKFGDVVTIALDHLGQLEKDLIKVVRTVLLALKSPNFSLAPSAVSTLTAPSAAAQKTPALGFNNNQSSVVNIAVPGDIENRKRKRTASVNNNDSVVFDSMVLPQVPESRPVSTLPSPFGPSNASLIQQAFMNNNTNITPRQSYTTVFNRDIYSQLSSMIVPDHTHFLQSFVDKGYRIDEVKYDGNQQFRALAHQIYGTEHSHAIVRMLIASEILANPNLYEKFIDIPGVGLQEYVQIMSREGMKGDHLTLTAFVNYYGVDLMLYSPAIEHPVLIQSRKNVASPKTLQLLVLADHYRSLVSLKEVLLRNKLEAFRTQTMMKLMHNQENDTSEDSDDEGDPERLKRQPKRARASDDPLQRVEERRKKDREKKMKLRGLGPASLSQLCLERIVHAIDYFESFSGKLPQELLHELLAKLGENKKLSDKTIAKVLDPSLQRFVLKGPCPSVTDLTMFQLSRRCKGLQELHLVSCFTISDRSMQQVIPNSPELEHIVINNCPQIGNLTIQEIARNCPKLTSFTLIQSMQVTDVAIQELTLACPLLVNLVISRCPRITDVSLMYPPRGLQVFTIADCPLVTDATAMALARNCGASLRAVRFGRHVIDASVDSQTAGSNPGGTMKITDQGIALIAAASPGLEAITLTAQNGDLAVAALGHHCKGLLTLDATGSQVTDRAFVGDSGMPAQINQQPAPFLNNQQGPFMNNQPGPGMPVLNNQVVPMIPAQPQIPIQASVFPHLQKIVLAHCVAVTDLTVSAVARNCPDLKHLNVAHCERLTDESIIQIAEQCPRLSILDVTKCTNLTDRAVTAVARYCRDLKKIIMSNCSLVSTQSLEELAANCHELMHVNLSRCDGATDGTLVKLGMNCPLLQILELEDCTNVTENGIVFVTSKCTRVTVLKIGYCASLTDNGLFQISQSCSQIRELDLSQCQQITITGLQRALDNWPILSKLNVMGCRGMTRIEGAHPPAFLAHPPLEEINLSWCQNIDDQAILDLSLGCPNLIKVDLAWCNRFAGTSLPTLVQQCQSLKYINLRGCTKVSQLTMQYLSSAGVFIWR